MNAVICWKTSLKDLLQRTSYHIQSLQTAYHIVCATYLSNFKTDEFSTISRIANSFFRYNGESSMG